jgi:hypothetical protein
MDNEGKAGAGRTGEPTAEDIDRHGSDAETIPDRARDTAAGIAGTGPEIARHIARENPGTSSDDHEDEEDMDDDTSTDEDDEDDDDLEEEEDEEAGVDAEDDRGTPGYGDRGNTPI